ncbi:bacterioferritin-associated ferredoxin [Elioraea sp.]|uniref:(2Fe-2S)-binding protein n=1 Tax=Elioraea sp. TaxID=2185103 RepID=UPI00262FADA8|nr:(2Fe-2S)-binding protein [Elioraea sp.]
MAPARATRPGMLVCLCNGLTDRAIRSAAERGATCCKGVWDRCGCRPDCGQCGQMIRAIVADHHARPRGHAVPPAMLAPAKE